MPNDDIPFLSLAELYRLRAGDLISILRRDGVEWLNVVHSPPSQHVMTTTPLGNTSPLRTLITDPGAREIFLLENLVRKIASSSEYEIRKLPCPACQGGRYGAMPFGSVRCGRCAARGHIFYPHIKEKASLVDTCAPV